MAAKNPDTSRLVQQVFGLGETTYDLKSGRITIPAEFLATLSRNVRITIDPKRRFLEIRSSANFDALVRRIDAQATTMNAETWTALRRHYLGLSGEGQIDAGSRLVLPKRLRDLVDGLSEENALILLGSGDFLEVWPASRHHEDLDDGRHLLDLEYSSLRPVIMNAPNPLNAGSIDQSQCDNTTDSPIPGQTADR